jgi:hypothetical protein
MRGGHKISEEYHRVFAEEEQEFRWTNEVKERTIKVSQDD